MSCQIKRKYDGTIKEVLAPNGNPSILYRDIVQNVPVETIAKDAYVQNIVGKGLIADASKEELALALWSKAYSKEFMDSFGNWTEDKLPNTDINGEPLYYDVANIAQSKPVGSPENTQYQFAAVNKITANLDRINKLFKKIGNNDVFWNKLQQDFKIPKSQVELIKNSEGNNVEEKLASFVANYSYTVTSNTITQSSRPARGWYSEEDGYQPEEFDDEGTPLFVVNFDTPQPTDYYSYLTVPGGIKYTENEIATPDIIPSIKGHAEFATPNGIGWFRADEQVTGGETISPDEWEGDNVIIAGRSGRLPIANVGGTATKTRRILEVQSDLFQKGRDKSDLIIKEDYNATQGSSQGYGLFSLRNINYAKTRSGFFKNGIKITEEEYNKALEEHNNPITYGDKHVKENQFLQLLNKDNNWVTFFLKAVIQDSAKKGYKKVLFPSGNTASKIEGHTTLEEFKKQKEDAIRIKTSNSEQYQRNINRYNAEIQEIDDKLNIISQRPSFNVEVNRTGEIKLDGKTVATNGKMLGNEYTVTLEDLGNRIYKNQGDYNTVRKSIRESYKTAFEKQYNIKELKEEKQDLLNYIEEQQRNINKNIREINQLKQELERIETEGFGALKPIYNFYENIVANILKKQGYNPVLITDEYGNTWNEVTIEPEKHTSPIELYQLKTDTSTEKDINSEREEIFTFIKDALVNAGFDIKSLDEAAKITGKDYSNVDALVNFAVKVVALSNNVRVDDIAEEAAHVAVAHAKLHRKPMFDRAMELVIDTSEYKEDYDRYYQVYAKDHSKEQAALLAKEEIVGKIVKDYVIKGFERKGDSRLISILRSLWNRFISLFKNNELQRIAVQFSSDLILGKVNAEEIKHSAEFYSLKKEQVNYGQLLNSLLKREKALIGKRGANVINIRKQIKAIREQIDDLENNIGTLKFIEYLDQDTETAISYLGKYSFDIRSNAEEINRVKATLKALEERQANNPTDDIAELIKLNGEKLEVLQRSPMYIAATLKADGMIPSMNHIHQYQELISYYKPYLETLRTLSMTKSPELVQAIDKQIQKLVFIENMVDVLTPKATAIYLKESVKEITGNEDIIDVQEEVDFGRSKGQGIASGMAYWFGSLRDSSDTINRIVSTLMNNIYNTVRRKTLTKANEILEEFKDLVGKDTSWMYETLDGKRTGRYIDGLHWTKWIEGRKAFHSNLHKKYGYPEDGHERSKLKKEILGYDDIIKELRKQPLTPEIRNTIAVMQKAIVNLKAYNKEIRQWYTTNSVPRNNLDDIIDNARRTLTANQFKEWLDRNVEFNDGFSDLGLQSAVDNDPSWKSYVAYYKYNFVQPSDGRILTLSDTSQIKTTDWSNKAYNKLSDKQKQQLDRVKEIKADIDNNLLDIPINDLPPQTYESTLDLFFRNNMPTIWKKLRGHIGSAFVSKEDDVEYNPDLYETDQSLSGYVPIRYTHKLSDPSRISTDAISNLILYYNMATDYNEKAKHFPKFSVVLEHVKKRKIVTETKKGNVVSEGSDSWNTKALEHFLKVHLLGEGRQNLEVDTPLGTVNISKIVQKASNWIRAKNLGLNFATMFSNYASSEAFLAVERIVGQYINKNSYKQSYSTLMSNLSDLMRRNSTNKVAVLRRTFGLGRDLHALFNDLDKHLFVREQPSKFMFYGYELGDFMTKSIAMLSVLYDYKLHEGNWYSSRELAAMNVTGGVNMYDYLVVKDGKIDNEIDQKVLDRISNKIQYVANGIDGKITDVDKGAIYHHALFSMVTIHRNWLFDGISKRFKQEGYNFRTLQMEKGYYRDFPSAFQVIGNFFYSEKRMFSLQKALAKYHSLQPWQQDNVRRLYTEMLMISAFTALAIIINNAAGDDDDDYTLDLMAYLSNRALLEVSAFYNPTEITTALSSPFVPARDLELIMDVGKAFDFSEIERGPWEGYSHAGKYWLQWIPGVKGVNMLRDPNAPNQFLKNKPLKPLYTIVE